MKDTIYAINKNKEFVELTEKEYDSEDMLQELLENYPKLLAGAQINSEKPRKWLFISRELSVPDGMSEGRWSVDHLFIDQDAVPTIVEVKRSDDTRIRREVIGQMVDYAANAILYWPINHIISNFENTCEKRNIDSNEVIKDFLENNSEEEFWDRVKTNLQAGKIRLLFVADVIPNELQRAVEFLNEQMDPAEVLAVEIKRFSGNEFETYVPRLIGKTAESSRKKGVRSRGTKDWNKDSILAELKQRNDDKVYENVLKIFEWSEKNMSRNTFGHGLTYGSYIPVYDYEGENFWPFSLWTSGAIEIQFQYLKDKKPFDKKELRLELLKKLNKIDNISISEDRIDFRPGIKLKLLNEENIDELLSVFNWVLKKINENHG